MWQHLCQMQRPPLMVKQAPDMTCLKVHLATDVTLALQMPGSLSLAQPGDRLPVPAASMACHTAQRARWGEEL